MQVHGQHTVGAGGGEHVGHELRGDGVAGLGLAVLPGIAEVGDHGGDPAGGSTLEGVDHHQQLHQVVVHGATGGLDHKHIGAANGFVNGDEAFSVRKVAALQVTQRQAQFFADGLRQSVVGVAAENFQIFAM